MALDVRDVIRRLYANKNILAELSKSNYVSGPTMKLSGQHSFKETTLTKPIDDSVDRAMEDFNPTEYYWAEILCERSNHDKAKSISNNTCHAGSIYRWTHVDPVEIIINDPMSIQNLARRGDTLKSVPIVYAVGIEHEVLNVCTEEEVAHFSDFQRGTLTDVTPRYSKSWSQTLIHRGSTKKQLKAGVESEICTWWNESIQRVNHLLHKRQYFQHDNQQDLRKGSIEKRKDTSNRKLKEKVEDDKMYNAEQREFRNSIANEPIPTNKLAFKNHPLYVIPSALNANEVLNPQSSQRLAGFFKGERVYMRSDVSLALPAKQWLYRGRKVKASDLSKPVKTMKARKKPSKRGFKALETYGTNRDLNDEIVIDDGIKGMVDLYGDWQTDSWSPPYVGPDDPIPVNEHRNVELALIPPGLIHLEKPRMAFIAKKLAIPYAPCLVGFERFKGNGAPMVQGIVVHQGNADIILEAYAEWESKEIEDQLNDHQTKIIGRWKRLVFAALTDERLKKKYEND